MRADMYLRNLLWTSYMQAFPLQALSGAYPMVLGLLWMNAHAVVNNVAVKVASTDPAYQDTDLTPDENHDDT